MESYYGQIDLTVLGKIVRQHPELVKKVPFKDGVEHQLLNININARQHPSDKGHTHYIKANVKKAEQVQGVNYYLGDLKPSTFSMAQPAAQPTPQTPAQQAQGNDDLPF